MLRRDERLWLWNQASNIHLAIETINPAPEETRELNLSSKRFVDMKEDGWISGDMHLHWVTNKWNVDLPLEHLSLVQKAEDLRVVNNLTLLHRRLPVELIIDVFPVAAEEISSDGVEQILTFELTLEKSSWAAIRVFLGTHANLVFVMLNDKQVRASPLRD
jgi:hypothetical protein